MPGKRAARLVSDNSPDIGGYVKAPEELVGDVVVPVAKTEILYALWF